MSKSKEVDLNTNNMNYKSINKPGINKKIRLNSNKIDLNKYYARYTTKMSLSKDIAEMDKLEKKLDGFLIRVIRAMKLGHDIVPLEKEYDETKSRLLYLRRKHKRSVLFIHLSPDMPLMVPISPNNKTPLITLKCFQRSFEN